MFLKILGGRSRFGGPACLPLWQEASLHMYRSDLYPAEILSFCGDTKQMFAYILSIVRPEKPFPVGLCPVSKEKGRKGKEEKGSL